MAEDKGNKQPAPLSSDVAAAVERCTVAEEFPKQEKGVRDGHVIDIFVSLILRDDLRTLLRAVRAPRLTEEQNRTLVSAVARLHSHGTERDDAVSESICAAFPELGEVEHGS